MSHDYHMQPVRQAAHPATYRHYVAGFLVSAALTLTAYWLVVTHISTAHTWPSDQILVPAIIVLALVQFAAQLIFFLHIHTESKPRWKLLVFSFMMLIVAILVLGSLWIMNNLSYHGSPSGTDSAIIKDEGIHK